MRPVRGFSDGTFSIVMEKRAVSASTSMRWVLRSSAGSAQISSRVWSGPMPARLSAAATLTLAGKPRAPSRAVPSNTLLRALEVFERDAALDEIGRAVEPVRRLARDHGDRTDGAFGGGAHRIETDQCAGRHQNARAGLFGPLDQIPVFQKLADQSGMKILPRSITEIATARNSAGGRHSTTMSQVSRQRFGGHDRNAAADSRQIAPRLVLVAHRDGGEDEAGNAGFDPPRHVEADGAKPGQSDLERSLAPRVPPALVSRPSRPDTFVSMRRPKTAQCSRCRMRARMPDRSKRHFMTNINPNTFTTRPEIEGTFGVVTSTHWIATAVGMGILEKGGNAFDAAVATAFTLQVVEPHLNGPGGDVPVILYDVRRGKPEVICGQGAAPAGATIAHYRSEGLDLVPGTGLLAACVPGTFETWMMLLRDYGTMSLADVLAPAIGYAQNGHPLLERANATIAHGGGRCSASIGRPRPRSICRTTRCRRPGSLFTNKTLAATYGRIVKEAESAGGDRVAQIERARKSWSQGFVAEAIDRFCRTQDIMDTSGHKHRGVLTADDMARWTPHVEAPLTYDYRPLHGVQDRALGPGPGDVAAACAAQGLRSRRARSDRAGLHPSHRRVLEARLRRPRSVLRRSGFRRSADGDAVVGRLQLRAPQARRPTRPRSNCAPARSRVSARW